MKTNHTPGPWRIERTDTITDFTIVPHFQKARQKKNPIGFTYQTVCHVSRSTVKDVGIRKPEFQHDTLPQGEAIANARLIAAAPELLTALKNLVATLDDLDRDNAILKDPYGTTYTATQRSGLKAKAKLQARAAIAKATGN